MRRTAEHAAQTRADILTAARAAFSQEGYAGTSAEEICRGANVSRGALYHHFGGKRGVFLAVFELLETELDEHARSAVASSLGRTVDPLDALLIGCRAYLEFATREDYRRIAMVEGRAVLGDAMWHELDASLGLTTIESAITGLQGLGVLRPVPARPLAVLVLGALNEAGFALARGESRVDEQALLATVRDLLEGLREVPEAA